MVQHFLQDRRGLPNACWLGQSASQHLQIDQWRVMACTFSLLQISCESHSALDGREEAAHLLSYVLLCLHTLPVIISFFIVFTMKDKIGCILIGMALF